MVRKLIALLILLTISVSAQAQRSFGSSRAFLTPAASNSGPSLESVCTTSGFQFSIDGFAQTVNPAGDGYTTGGCQSGLVYIRVGTLLFTDDAPGTTCSQIVSNKGADGVNSIVEAARCTGPAAIGFSVSGDIHHSTGITIFVEDDKTFYGGDAPNFGVQFINVGFWLRKNDPAASSNNIIFSFIKIRMGLNYTTSPGRNDLLHFAGDKQIAHRCSLWWAKEQANLNMKGDPTGATTPRVTVTETIASENLGTGIALQTSNPIWTTSTKNLFINNTRHFETGTGKLGFAANVVYNPNTVTTIFAPGCSPPCGGGSFGGPLDMNVMFNDYRRGVDSPTGSNGATGGHVRIEADAEFIGSSHIYVSGNRGANCPDAGNQTNCIWMNNGSKTLETNPITMPGLTGLTAAQAFEKIITNRDVGPIYPGGLDALDSEAIDRVVNNNGRSNSASFTSQTWPNLNVAPPSGPQPRIFAQRSGWTNSRAFVQ
jgi:hypothetical protein